MNIFRYLIVLIKNGIGDFGVFLGGNIIVLFYDGWVNFINFNISYNGINYVLEYRVFFFVEVSFIFLLKFFEVKERILYFVVVRYLSDVNEIVFFG